MIRNVLVFPCESAVGGELHQALRHSAHFRLYGCSEDPGRGRALYENHLGALPALDSPLFLPELAKTIRNHAVHFVFPASDEAIVRMSEWSADSLIEAEVMTPGPDMCRICASKGATYAFFAGKLPVPRQFRLDELGDADFPVVIKPDSRAVDGGVHIAASRAEAEFMLRRSPLDSITEFLPGDEFTVDCFTDRSGSLLFVSGRERMRFSGGACVQSRLAENPLFRRYAETINVELRPRGPWFLQLKEDRFGTLRLTEVRARVGYVSGLQRAMGVNLPLLALRERLGMPVSVPANAIPRAMVERSLANHCLLDMKYDAAYVDLDDTVVVGGQVNLDAARFVFQCRNRGVPVFLVFRGLRHPEKILRRHRLDNLFDDVFWIRGNEGKSTVITHSRAVFVDDCPMERWEVRHSLGIPVFDPSGFESLLGPQ